MQAILITSVLIVLGVIFGTEILLLMGASSYAAIHRMPFIRIMMGSYSIITLLFLTN